MPALTPLDVGSESLTPLTGDTQTIAALDEDSQSLGALSEDLYGWEFLRPGASTYPGATTYPGLYGEELGLALATHTAGAATLTPLTED